MIRQQRRIVWAFVLSLGVLALPLAARELLGPGPLDIAVGKQPRALVAAALARGPSTVAPQRDNMLEAFRKISREDGSKGEVAAQPAPKKAERKSKETTRARARSEIVQLRAPRAGRAAIETGRSR